MAENNVVEKVSGEVVNTVTKIKKPSRNGIIAMGVGAGLALGVSLGISKIWNWGKSHFGKKYVTADTVAEPDVTADTVAEPDVTETAK